jgi:hypothetical protein
MHRARSETTELLERYCWDMGPLLDIIDFLTATKHYFASKDVRFDESLFYKDIIVQSGRVMADADEDTDDETALDSVPQDVVQRSPKPAESTADDEPSSQPLIDLHKNEAPQAVPGPSKPKRTKNSGMLEELATELKDSAPKLSTRTLSGANLAFKNSSPAIGMAFMVEPGPRKKDSGEPAVDIKVYRQGISTLLYAALGSPPDIDYAVGVLGRYTPAANPNTSHMKCVGHLRRDIEGTIDRKGRIGSRAYG